MKLKQLVGGLLAVALVVTSMPISGPAARAADGGEAEFKKSGSEITIGNDYITRTFDISGGTVETTEINNKRADLTFSPAEGSEEFVIKLTDGTEIKTSEMQLEGDVVKEDTEEGILVKFPFETYEASGANWDITMNVSMEDGKHYMRKFLEIAVDNKKVAIDYIDLEHMNVGSDVSKDNQWTIGTPSGYEIPSHVMALGEPVYIQAMFFGCEFPATVTEIKSSNAHMRYYTGKDFEKLNEDNQLTLEGIYVTWPTVAGAARETDMNVIQSDFYEYIRDISTKTDFRTQYNSWYDNEKKISDENITNIFTQTEKKLAETGVHPLDSYVVDDGWINYNDNTVLNEQECGTTLNQTGFWEFNSKFPQGFGPASDLAHSFGSHFGVWVGPRGGYGYEGHIANLIEKYGFGAKNSSGGDIDVGDRRYIRKLTDYFCWMQDAYKVNYWKLDGFARAACTSNSHEHMAGGTNNMYYFSDLWEGWIDLFETLRANAKKNGIDNLWLNLTCYVTPTPWLLQWANSIWIQNSADVSLTDSSSVEQDSQADRYLSYRDGRYFDFVKNGGFQFPLENIFNHDPVYGKSINQSLFPGGISMTDEEFQTCLYMMATRGMAFWEMLYSPSMIDQGQKWEINAEALLWARENHHILRNAKLLGESPANNKTATGKTYGFSCWDGEEGIISMRNPSKKEQELTFTLNRAIGAAESLEEDNKTLYRTTVLDYKTTDAKEKYATLHYGDTVTVMLQPGEATIWKLSTKKDTTPAKVQTVKVLEESDSVKVKVTFDERIQKDDNAVTSDGGAAVVTKDGRSVEVTLSSKPADKENISFTLSGVKDLSGNASPCSVKTTYHQNGVVAQANEASDLESAGSVKDTSDSKLRNIISLDKGYKLTSGEYTGETEFSVSAYIKTEGKDASLISQGSEYSLSLNADGKLVFTVGDQSVTSKQKVNDGEWRHVAGIRERNGMLKVYVDGAPDGGLYVPEMKDIAGGAVEVGAKGLNVEMSSVTVRDRSLSLSEIETGGKTAESMSTTVKHKVVFQTNGGNEIDTLKVVDGGSWELPEAPEREGYKFAGWCTDPNCANAFDEPSSLNADLYLYAKWTKLHKVTVYTYGVLTDQTVVLEVEDGKTVEGLDDLTRPGAKLLGWYLDHDQTQEFTETTAIDRDMTLYPKYEIDEEISQSWEKLEDEIAEMEKAVESDYTEESWRQFEQALLDAQSAVKNAETKADLDTAMKALQSAYGKLKKKEPVKPDVPTPGTPGTPGTSASGGATKLATPVVTVKSSWNGVQVSWNAISGATSYTVSRNGEIMNTVTATRWLDERPLGGKVNTYQVTANGDGTKTLASAPGSKATGKLPKAATKLKAKKSGKKVTLSWKKVKKASYVVMRATKKNGPYKKIKTLKKNTYTDKKAKGKTAYYKVVVKSGKLYSPATKAKRVKL